MPDLSPVVMVRHELWSASPVAPPHGYRLRSFTEGDEKEWVRVQSIADLHNTITSDLFVRAFPGTLDELKARQIYAVTEYGEVVGTVTAWFPKQGLDPALGRLHWLAVVPDEQGKGLGAALVAATLV